jgi:beta-glucosidase
VTIKLNNSPKITGVLATAKHFIGDGATQYGFDEGDDNYTSNDEAKFWHENGQGYEGAIKANVGSIMVSYSAIDGNT